MPPVNSMASSPLDSHLRVHVSYPLSFYLLLTINRMPLPSSGQVYLTGKIRLENGLHENETTSSIFYIGTVECRRTWFEQEMVRGIFKHPVTRDSVPLQDGFYNASCKVDPCLLSVSFAASQITSQIVAFHSNMNMPVPRYNSKEILLYGQILDVGLKL